MTATLATRFSRVENGQNVVGCAREVVEKWRFCIGGTSQIPQAKLGLQSAGCSCKEKGATTQFWVNAPRQGGLRGHDSRPVRVPINNTSIRVTRTTGQEKDIVHQGWDVSDPRMNAEQGGKPSSSKTLSFPINTMSHPVEPINVDEFSLCTPNSVARVSSVPSRRVARPHRPAFATTSSPSIGFARCPWRAARGSGVPRFDPGSPVCHHDPRTHPVPGSPAGVASWWVVVHHRIPRFPVRMSWRGDDEGTFCTAASGPAREAWCQVCQPAWEAPPPAVEASVLSTNIPQPTRVAIFWSRSIARAGWRAGHRTTTTATQQGWTGTADVGVADGTDQRSGTADHRRRVVQGTRSVVDSDGVAEVFAQIRPWRVVWRAWQPRRPRRTPLATLFGRRWPKWCDNVSRPRMNMPGCLWGKRRCAPRKTKVDSCRWRGIKTYYAILLTSAPHIHVILAPNGFSAS